MTDLPHATRITLVLRGFNRSDHHLCSSNFQPIDPVDLTYEKIISKLGSAVGDNSSLFNSTISEDENVHRYVEHQFRCLIFIRDFRSPYHAEIRLRFLSLLDKKSDVGKSRRRPKSAGGQLTANVQLERT
ncbi:unnamed protein product [Hymenolepis diminuta]|uniref:Uncharacterized protein n=1 Tax=Hymenolepis diminuta TaxID=6216 RepID=A0A564YSW9_HYMDI|nr:unnamed protein product [Hymenolepis diminuta]